MKTIVLALALAATVFAAEPAKKKAKAATPAAAPKGITIPKDAVPNSDGNTYSWTDKDGKKWVFSKTPFGIIKSPSSEAATPSGNTAAGPSEKATPFGTIKSAAADQSASSAAANDGLTKAIDKGDTVRFERPGPFGVIAWEKKKTELNESERSIVDAGKANPQ